MKFGKTYSILLPTFPQTWQERAISYSKLKKLIHGVVDELSLLGLDPTVLHDLLQDDSDSTTGHVPHPAVLVGLPIVHPEPLSSPEVFEERSTSIRDSIASGSTSSLNDAPQTATHAVYELTTEGDVIIPRLRLTLGPKSPTSDHGTSNDASISLSVSDETSSRDDHSQHDEHEDLAHTPQVVMASNAQYVSQPNTLFALQRHHIRSSSAGTISANAQTTEDANRFLEDVELNIPESESGSLPSADPSHPSAEEAGLPLQVPSESSTNEVVIPLNSDTAFYRVLVTALRSLSEHQDKVQQDFTATVEQLSTDISNVSHPSSTKTGRSDLSAWRSIFQLWVDMQIFESSIEKNRGERSFEDAEKRLTEFANKVVERGFGDSRTLQRKESRDALERFLQINVLLLDLKKFQLANAEATRKIMKKHDKRTALMFPRTPEVSMHPILAALVPTAPKTSHGLTLPHLLVVLLTDTLLPIIPSIDDYTCLICTSLAYIPIRLRCSHLFCVRCLTKMQKRGQAECPLCRSHTVLQANRDNVDMALKRFMVDWFPKETKEKDKANQKEAAHEQALEMGYQDRDCVVM